MNITTRNQNVNFYAEQILKEIGIEIPTFQQVERIKELLTKSGVVTSELRIPDELSKQEISCLILSVQGKQIHEIAKELNISESSIQTYKQRIREKLKCNTMEQVIFECIRYCYLTPLGSN